MIIKPQMNNPLVWLTNNHLTQAIQFILLGVSVSSTALAQSNNIPDNTEQIPIVLLDGISIYAEAGNKNNNKHNNENDHVATHAPTSLKSNNSLFETAKSVSVVTKKQIEQKQATTLSETLQGVAGVTSGQYGRRGWDDILIRGQLASSQILVDGMRASSSTNFLNGMEVSGLEAVEVVKGPDSVGFGQMMPGGVVNLTTKKPKATNEKNVTLSAGSYDFYQGTFDINHAPNQSTDGAFRINGRISNQNDNTDIVYFKNHYIAPSYRFNIGDDTDMTVLASYQKRDYIRQQGLPLQNDTYKRYSPRLFFGEPQFTINDDVLRLGYQLNHNFTNGWQFHQNFSTTKRDADAEVIIASGTAPMDSQDNMKRQYNKMNKKDTLYALDSRINKIYPLNDMTHDVTLGLDGFYEQSDYKRQAFAYSPLNLKYPVYGVGKITNDQPIIDSHVLNHLQYLGLYAKDTITLADRWVIGLAGRHDWSDVKSKNKKNNVKVKNSNNAFTTTASLMYKHNNTFAPYVSYATSFLASANLGKDNELLDPETGKQFEVGVKLQSPDQRMQGSLSYYDLTRNNVIENHNDGKATYSIAIGEQKTKGFEAEAKAWLNDNLNIIATYSHIPTATVTKAANRSFYVAGQRINHIPKHAFNLNAQYYFNPEHTGWYIGGGMRYESERHAERGRSAIDLPSYTLYDAEAGYENKHYKLGLSVKNLTDKNHIAGTSPNASLVTFGEPRTYRLNFTYKF